MRERKNLFVLRIGFPSVGTTYFLRQNTSCTSYTYRFFKHLSTFFTVIRFKCAREIFLALFKLLPLRLMGNRKRRGFIVMLSFHIKTPSGTKITLRPDWRRQRGVIGLRIPFIIAIVAYPTVYTAQPSYSERVFNIYIYFIKIWSRHAPFKNYGYITQPTLFEFHRLKFGFLSFQREHN